MKLNKTETILLLAIITGNTNTLKNGLMLDKAKTSLIEKGFLRINEYHILELNLSLNYFEERGYK